MRVHRAYDSFGNVTGETHYGAAGVAVTAGQAGYVTSDVGYTGKFFDNSTGQQQNLHRWYDPQVGRWVSEDPIGFAGGDANLSRYVGNAATTAVEPSGLVPPAASNAAQPNRLPQAVVQQFLNAASEAYRQDLARMGTPEGRTEGYRLWAIEQEEEAARNVILNFYKRYANDCQFRAQIDAVEEAAQWSAMFTAASTAAEPITSRLEGVMRATAGAGFMAGGAALPSTGLGAIVSPLVFAWRIDQFYAGMQQAVDGQYHPSFGRQSILALGGMEGDAVAYDVVPWFFAGRLQGNGARGAAADPCGVRAANSSSIGTPYGTAIQDGSEAALRARAQLQGGATAYKGGRLGRSEAGSSQFLATESPLNPGYAGRYGIPPENANFDFILTGRVRPGAPVVTRPSPGIPPNPGGGIEGVVNPGDFIIDSFYMP